MSALSPMAGPPPGALAALLGGGGAPAPAPSPGGNDPWEQELQVALSALRKLAADAPDHIEAQTVDQCVLAIQKLLAQRQSGAENALGVTPAHKAMSRAY